MKKLFCLAHARALPVGAAANFHFAVTWFVSKGTDRLYPLFSNVHTAVAILCTN